MDGITLLAIVEDFRKRLPLKVRRIYQPSASELHILLWGKDGEVRLGVSVDPQFPFFGPIRSHPQYPPTPPSFCQLLRSRLEGQSLICVEQADADRYVSLIFVPHPSLDSPSTRTLLVCDLRGPRSNIFLVEPGGAAVSPLKKKGQVRSVPPADSLGRLEDGSSPAGGAEIKAELDERELKEALESSIEPWRTITSFLPGAGKEISISILTEAGVTPSLPVDLGNADKIAECLRQMKKRVDERRWEPCVYRSLEGRPVLHVLPVAHLERISRFDSPEEAAASYYDLAVAYREFQTLKRQQISLLSLLQRKLSSRLDAQERDSVEASSYEELRIWGELLYASGKKLPPGFRSVRVVDYYQDPPSEVEIPLDPSKSLEENARSYLEKYKKLKRTHELLRESVKRIREGLDAVREVEELLASASSKEELLALGDEIEAIAQQHDIRLRREVGHAPSSGEGLTRTVPTRERSPRVPSFAIGEYRVFVGGTSRQNDYLVTRLSRPGDIWLHAKGVPGAHVLIRPPSGVTVETVDPSVLLEAARIAATRSQARHAGKVDVDYTDARHVKKPPGSSPGFVTYSGQKTLTVSLKDGEHTAQKGDSPS
ncbi:MAG: NFACT family protein [Firmicutes bacterium]|nr:NFACT family protein [Candidatus Fermentithermobacillaceae bacterium]